MERTKETARKVGNGPGLVAKAALTKGKRTPKKGKSMHLLERKKIIIKQKVKCPREIRRA